jgi:putative component of membrane protein insertase Oxa1/YidC/SpoIIIJ protein YidD
MILSIHQKGVFWGYLAGMDRLTRCSPFAAGHYPFNKKLMKYEDPVE